MYNNYKKSNLKIGIIDPSDYTKEKVTGGSSGFIINIIPYLKYKKIVLFGIGHGNDTIPWKEYRIKDNILFISIGTITKSSFIPSRLKALIYYMVNRNKILSSGIDMLYIQMSECCLPFLFFNRKIPFVYHKHGSINPVEKSKFFFGRLKIFKLFFDLLLNLIYKKANWFIAIDRKSYNKALKKISGGRISLIRNAVDTNKFFNDSEIRNYNRKKLNYKESDCIIIYVGRIEKSKGLRIIVDCVPYLLKKNLSFKILMVGTGSYEEELRKKIINGNAKYFVTLLGHISHNDLLTFYNISDLLVLPSETEGAPMVILESLACGTPVVASNVGSISEIVQNNSTGIVLDDITPYNLSCAIDEVFKKKICRRFIANSIEKNSSAHFSKVFNKIVNKIIEV